MQRRRRSPARRLERARLQLGGARLGRRFDARSALLLEYYDEPSPYGQFYRQHVSYWGAGVHVALR